ncbi:MAG: hypothetical protein Q8O83_01895 [bacterium]|nr:hypothetical protein [bacterium]
MKKRAYFTRTAFFDVFLNMLLIFIFLFLLAILQVNPEKKKDEGIKLNEKFFIVMTWNNDLHDDIDLYVKDPEDHLVYFNRREDGLMHLDRDDLGQLNDTVITKDGRKIVVEKNEEKVALRDTIPGEYIVNVHLFRKTSNESVAVTIKLIELFRGADTEVLTSTVFLSTHGDEETAFRFTLDEADNITNTNHDQMSLYQFRVRQEGY